MKKTHPPSIPSHSFNTGLVFPVFISSHACQKLSSGDGSASSSSLATTITPTLRPANFSDRAKISSQVPSSSHSCDVIAFTFFGSSVLTAAQLLGKCQRSKERILKLIKFLNPNPHLFNKFNLLLIPTTIPLVVLCSKYPTISANHLFIVPTLFLYYGCAFFNQSISSNVPSTKF